jgi:hypothetical protein
MAQQHKPRVLAQSPDGQATLDAIAAFEAAVSNLDTIITAANANPTTAWDNATPQQRTTAIKNIAVAVRGVAWILKGVKVPLGSARAPD